MISRKFLTGKTSFQPYFCIKTQNGKSLKTRTRIWVKTPERAIRNHNPMEQILKSMFQTIVVCLLLKLGQGESVLTSEAVCIQVCHLEIKYRTWWLKWQGNTETFWDIHYLFDTCPPCLRNFLTLRLQSPHRCSYKISVTQQNKVQLLR